MTELARRERNVASPWRKCMLCAKPGTLFKFGTLMWAHTLCFNRYRQQMRDAAQKKYQEKILQKVLDSEC